MGSDAIQDTSMAAAADLRDYTFYAVRQTAARTVNIGSAVTQRAIGILQNNPPSGGAARVRVAGISQAVVDGSGAAIAADDLLGMDAAGRLVKVTTADRPVIARALEAATTQGAVIDVMILPGAQVYRVPA